MRGPKNAVGVICANDVALRFSSLLFVFSPSCSHLLSLLFFFSHFSFYFLIVIGYFVCLLCSCRKCVLLWQVLHYSREKKRKKHIFFFNCTLFSTFVEVGEVFFFFP